MEDGQKQEVVDFNMLDTCFSILGQLISTRNEARKNKDFKKSDRIRDALLVLGIELKDTAYGMTIPMMMNRVEWVQKEGIYVKPFDKIDEENWKKWDSNPYNIVDVLRNEAVYWQNKYELSTGDSNNPLISQLVEKIKHNKEIVEQKNNKQGEEK